MPVGAVKTNKTKKSDSSNIVKPVKVFILPTPETKPQIHELSAPDVLLTPQNIIGTGTNQAQAGLKLSLTGQAFKFNGIEWSPIDNQWLNKGDVSDYEVRATYSKFESKGSYSFTGKIGTWVDLTSTKEWISYANDINSSLLVGLNIEIRNISSKSVVATAPITLTAYTSS